MAAIKSELQSLLWPLLCHIYIEMVKGRDARPAHDFLRKYAHLIGSIEHLSLPVVNKLNGSPGNDKQEHGLFVPPAPSASTQITFKRDELVPNGAVDETCEYFKDLASSLSLCLRIDELESIEITRNFRNAKYDFVLSLQTLYAIKHFLGSNGHVMILHIFQTWFSFDILEALIELDSDEEDMDEDDDCASMSESNGRDVISEESNDYAYEREDPYADITDLISKAKMGTKIINRIESNEIAPVDRVVGKPSEKLPVPNTLTVAAQVASSDAVHEVRNKHLQNIRSSVMRSGSLENPMRVVNILNAGNQLCSANLDQRECHMVCGFDDSTIRLWQMNLSRICGRKPHTSYTYKLCEWCLDTCDTSSDEDYFEVDAEKKVAKRKQFKRRQIFGRPTPANFYIDGAEERQKRNQKREFWSQRCEDNIL